MQDMSTCIALLRAVNVGGTKLPMADLRALLEGLGYGDVCTYLQSGNAVFETGEDAGSPTELANAIAIRIERDVGPRVGVLVLRAPALEAVVAANPFLTGPAADGETASPDEQFLHGTFLFGSGGDADFGQASEAAYSKVYESTFAKLELPADEGEEAAFVGVPPLDEPVVYLKLPHGYGRTRLTNAWFERRLGTTATTRNWRTVRALVELAGGDGSRGGSPA
jgi:uncharacterized protein (DUF1697 family)